MERLNSFKQNVQSLCEKLNSEGSCQVQKIYSSVNAICFVLRFKGETSRLWIGRGGDTEGVLYPGPECPASSRVKDRFLELQRRTLKGVRVVMVKMIGEGHFLLEGVTKRQKVFCLYSWAEGKLFYSSLEQDDQKTVVFSPWIDAKRRVDADVQTIDSLILLHRNQLKAKIRNPITDELLGGLKTRLTKVVNKKKKFLRRKAQNIEKDLQKVRLADRMQLWASSLVEGELPGPFIEFEGVKIKFTSAEGFYQKRDLIFQKAKAFRAAESLLSHRLEETEKELNSLFDNDMLEPEKILSFQSRQRAKSPAWLSSKKEAEKHDPGASIQDSAIYHGHNAKLAIGLTAKANDQLRNTWAKKSDIWFHLDAQTSPHAFLKLQEDKTLTLEELEAVASAISFHAKGNQSEIDLMYTKAKYLKSIKGKPGLVKYTNEKRIRVKYRADWKEILANL